jgi:UDP-N-acetylmuramate dehydrogenase
MDGEKLMARLPAARGRLTPMRPLDELSWLRVGGPAEVLFQPADREDLAAFLAALPDDVPVTPIGVCSNLIIRDGGVPGVVIRLGRGFNKVEMLEGARVRAGAAVLDAQLAKAAAEAGVAGLEFLRTIPGAVGGALRMNAGCYGAYMADVFVEATAVSRAGEVVTLGPEDMGFAYRSCALPDDMVIVEAVFQGRLGVSAEIEAVMADYIARREESQPVRDRTAGSTFRNPAGFSSTGRADDTHEMKAWKLIEDAGGRGLRRGGAVMNPRHANFLTNAGGATATELEALGEEIRKRVLENSGISLEWEIKRIGINPTE